MRGAPGGWAHTALDLGARVVAVDRTELVPAVREHPGFREMVQGDAFAYTPVQPVDWLLCDVICDPARSLELAERWMNQALCRRLCVTLKFKGDSGYGTVDHMRKRLARVGWPFLRIKHLRHHQNEAVILAFRD